MRFRLIFVLFSCFVLFISLVSSLEISNSLLRVNVHQGDFTKVPFSIFSEEGGEFTLSVEGINGISLNKDFLVLEPGQKGEVEVSFDSSLLSPDVYSGSIKIVSDLETRYLPIIFEVESSEVLFDADIEVPLKYLEVSSGDKIVSNIEIFDLTEFRLNNSLGKSDVELEFTVLDTDGTIIFSESDNLTIEGKTSVTKTLDLPEEIDPGDYFITVVVKHGSSVGTSSSSFTVNNEEISVRAGESYFITIIVIVLSLVVILLIYLYFLRKNSFLIGRSKKDKNMKGNVKELTIRDIKKIFR